MNEQPSNAPRVTRIEIHYDDGSKDEIVTVSKYRTYIPLFSWSRSSSISNFKHARTSVAVAGVLFQTALTRRLMNHEPHDKDFVGLLRGFAHIWYDIDYPPTQPTPQKS
jgi:hypothetical protein